MSQIRTWLCMLFLASMCVSLPALAGNQKEEAISDAVRLALSNAIADASPPKPTFSDVQQRIQYLDWLASMSVRLQNGMPDTKTRREFLETVWYEAKRAGVDPELVLGLIQVESAFQKYAISTAKALGYMQVMPFWAHVVGDGDHHKLFHMQTNLRYGCSILRMYIDIERGNLFMALGRYNGSRGRNKYPNAVLSAWKKWKLEG